MLTSLRPHFVKNGRLFCNAELPFSERSFPNFDSGGPGGGCFYNVDGRLFRKHWYLSIQVVPITPLGGGHALSFLVWTPARELALLGQGSVWLEPGAGEVLSSLAWCPSGCPCPGCPGCCPVLAVAAGKPCPLWGSTVPAVRIAHSPDFGSDLFLAWLERCA